MFSVNIEEERAGSSADWAVTVDRQGQDFGGPLVPIRVFLKGMCVCLQREELLTLPDGPRVTSYGQTPGHLVIP